MKFWFILQLHILPLDSFYRLLLDEILAVSGYNAVSTAQILLLYVALSIGKTEVKVGSLSLLALMWALTGSEGNHNCCALCP